MNIFMFIYLLLILTYVTLSYGKKSYLEFTNNKNPYQAIIFSYNLSNVDITFQNFIFRTISLKTPTIFIDLATVENSEYDLLQQLPILENSRSSTLYIILDNEDKREIYMNRTYDILDLFVKLAPVPTRPRCLLLLSSIGNIHLTETMKKILQQAWYLKFLDFTIIKYNDIEHTAVITYNPFADEYISLDMANVTSIFPDKLRDMHGYPIKLAAFNDSFFLIITSHANNNTISVSGVHFPFFEIFSKKLNFSLSFLIHDSTNFSIMLERLYNELDNGEINAIPILMISAMVYGNNHTLGRAIVESKLVMVVPIISSSKVLIDTSVLVSVLVFPIIMILLTATAFCLRLPRDNWQPLNLIRLLVGISALTGQPRRAVERVIFLATVVAAMKYSSDVFAKLMDVKLVNDELAFDSIKEILDSELPIYGMHRLMKDGNHDIARVMRSIGSSSDCMKLLLKGQKVICLSAIVNARNLLNYYHGRESGMKLAKPSFQYDFAAFPFERASPYREKMDEIALKVVESGMMDQWRKNPAIEPKTERKPKILSGDNQEKILLMELGVILTVGYFLAFVAFIAEQVIEKSCRGLS